MPNPFVPPVLQFLGASLGGSSEHAIPKLASALPGNIKFSSNVCCVVVEYVGGGTVKVSAFTFKRWLRGIWMFQRECKGVDGYHCLSSGYLGGGGGFDKVLVSEAGMDK